MAGATLLTPALVLGALRYGETSRIVRLATRDQGVLSVIAKGALRPRSRFGAALQLLSEGTAHVVPARSGDLHTLAAFDLTLLHGGLAQDLPRFAAASALAEVATRFVPPMPNPPLYDALRDAIHLMELAPADGVEVVALRSLWRLVADLGLGPVLERCARDGAPLPEGEVVFAVQDGGFLCPACARGGTGHRLATGDREALVALVSGEGPLPLLDPPHAAAHRRLFVRWVHHHLGEGALPALDFWRRGGVSA